MALRYNWTHITWVAADRIVHKEEEMASFIIAGTSKLVFILFETRCPEPGV